MAGPSDPWAMLDQIAGPEQAASPQPQAQQAPAPQPQASQARDPWLELDKLAGAEGQPSPQAQPQQPQQRQQPHGNQAPEFITIKAYDPNTMAANGTPTVADPETIKRTETFRAGVAQLLNSGANRDQIGAYAKQFGFTADDLPGLDQALQFRAKHPHAIVPVGISKAPPPPPTEQEKVSAGEAAATGLRNIGSMGWSDEFTAYARSKIGLSADGQQPASQVHQTPEQVYDQALKIERDHSQAAWDQHPYAYAAGGAVGMAPSAILAPGSTLPKLALSGAVIGGINGAGDATEGDRLSGALRGSAIGAVSSLALGKLANVVADRVASSATRQTGQDVLSAAERLNAGQVKPDLIQPLPGHVSNGGLLSLGHAVLEPSIAGGSLSGLKSATQRFEDNAGKALGRIADDAAGGTAEDLTTVAANANDPARSGSLAAYGLDSKAATDAIYGQAEHLAGDVGLKTPRTIAAIDALLAKSRATPGGIPGFDRLAQLREELANGAGGSGGKWTVDGLRRLRTSFGDSLDSTQRTAREAAKGLWPTLSQDISLGLNEQGNSAAAKAYRAADRAYSQRAANIDLITRIIGKDGNQSADAVANRLTSMARSDYVRLGKAMAAIPADQAAQIRGGLIDQMGHAVASAQDATGQAFSLTSFGTRWAKLSDQAKAALYSPSTIRDLNDLATLSSAQKGVQRLGNSSRSGVTMQNLGEAGAVWSGNWHALLATWATGAALGRPGVAKALVMLGRGTAPISAVTRRLAEAARRNPAIQREIAGMIGAINNPGQPYEAPAPAPAATESTVDPYANDAYQVDPNHPAYQEAPETPAPAPDPNDPNLQVQQ